MMLSVERVNVYLQASHILHDVSLHVAEREVVCLVGRNGAGKTTTLRTIMGYLKPHSGAIRFQGRDITRLPTFQIARLGIGYAPEESEIFPDLTVEENIAIATWTRPSERPGRERIELAYKVFPRLREYRLRKGTQMSGGERKMLSIARALALDPALLLLDEPFEGLSPAIIPVVAEGIAAITQLGRAILIAESNIYHVPAFADRLYVIERGEILYQGSPAAAEREPAVQRVIRGGT